MLEYSIISRIIKVKGYKMTPQAPTVSYFSAVIATAGLIYNIINGSTSDDSEITDRLDEISKELTEISSQLQALIDTIKFDDAVKAADDAATRVNDLYDTMQELVSGDPSKDDVADWLNQVFSKVPEESIESQINKIVTTFTGQSIFDSFFILFIEKARANPGQQSVKWLAESFYTRVAIILKKGLITLIAAKAISDDLKGATTLLSSLVHNELQGFCDFGDAKIKGQDDWYHNPDFGNEYDTAVYFDNRKLTAPVGNFITGIKFKSDGCIVPEIEYAPFTNGISTLKPGEKPSTISGARPNISFGDGSVMVSNYIHLEELKAPEGKAIKSIQLIEFHNRLALTISVVPLSDPLAIPEDIGPKDFGENNYFTNEERYTNESWCKVDPLSPLSGASLYKFGNRTSVQIQPLHVVNDN